MSVVFDHDRPRRIGMPEAVMCLGKSDEQLDAVLRALPPDVPVLLTRMDARQHERMADEALDYDPVSGTAFLHGRLPARPGTVAVVTAGTSDLAVAGMDGALASVVGGLLAAPVIGVPTSTGYGAARAGETALHSMLTSCAQGVLVTNIDNGFGAACAAVRILGRTSGPTAEQPS